MGYELTGASKVSHGPYATMTHTERIIVHRVYNVGPVFAVTIHWHS